MLPRQRICQNPAAAGNLLYVNPPTSTSIPMPPSPPSGPMTRARAKALYDKVNSLLSTCDFGSTLDGILLHSDTLCILRYEPPQPTSNGQGATVKADQDWSFRAGGSAIHQPESLTPLESSPHADRSLRPSRLSLEAPRVTTLESQIGGLSESPPEPEYPPHANRSLHPGHLNRV